MIRLILCVLLLVGEVGCIHDQLDEARTSSANVSVGTLWSVVIQEPPDRYRQFIVYGATESEVLQAMQKYGVDTSKGPEISTLRIDSLVVPVDDS